MCYLNMQCSLEFMLCGKSFLASPLRLVGFLMRLAGSGDCPDVVSGA